VVTQPVPVLRREYLFLLAKLCHLGAAQVDALTIADFAAYTDDIDTHIRQMNSRG
jgi:hypothetical protein